MAQTREVMSDETLCELAMLIWGGVLQQDGMDVPAHTPAGVAPARATLSVEDMQRWYSQGFVLSECSGMSFGLSQSSGGPCGVLAAAHGYALAALLFAEAARVTLAEIRAAFGSPEGRAAFAAHIAHASTHAYVTSRLDATRETHEATLAHALAFMVWQASPACTPVVADAASEPPHSSAASTALASLVLPRALAHGDATAAAAPLTPFSPADSYEIVRTASFPELLSCVREHLACFSRPGGVMLVLLSMILTRGAAAVRADMDEPSTLLSRFGMCSQELLNLSLTGAATSGILDGEQSTDGVVFRGVARQPVLGYLSAIEALRYGKVGDFYKTPLVPIWIVGSESHFSLLFGCDLTVNEESPSAHVYRAFKRYDEHDNQFIAVDKLEAVLRDLQLPHAHDAAAVARLRAQLDTSGAGIIVWSEFWQQVHPLVEAMRPQPPSASGPHPGTAAPAAAVAHAPAPTPSSTAAPAPASPPRDSDATYDGLLAQLRRAFYSHDTQGGGFILGTHVKPILTTLALPVAVDPSRGAAWTALADALRGGERMEDAIVLLDDLERAAEPHLREAVALRSAVAGAPAPSTSAGSKRPRSDSDLARELQRQLDAEAAVPAAASTGGSTQPASGLHAFIDLSSVPGGSAAPAPATRPRSESATAVSGDAVTGSEASASAYKDGSRIRSFELYHFNGMRDRVRVPRCVRLLLRQSDTGLPPVATHGDAATAAAVSLSMQDETAAAIAASQIEAGLSEDAALAAALAASMADSSAPASAATAAAMATPGSSTASRTRLTQLESILRTKWVGVVVSCDGEAPHLD